jgi:hypothetical protein
MALPSTVCHSSKRSPASARRAVFALDALARLAAESDRLAAEVAHLVDESDRIDAAAALRVRW